MSAWMHEKKTDSKLMSAKMDGQKRWMDQSMDEQKGWIRSDQIGWIGWMDGRIIWMDEWIVCRSKSGFTIGIDA